MRDPGRASGMLHPYRVLDLTDEKGFFCGKLFGDLGADIIKIERPGGDPGRNIGTFYHDKVEPEKSLFWRAFNNNKRGICLDIEAADGQDAFKRLVRGADYVVTRGSGKKLSLEEALELNDVIEESGLLHWWSNSFDITGLKSGCNCCRDCCVSLVPLDQARLPISVAWEKSRYEAYVNPDDCDGCQVCVGRCPFDAIEMERPEGGKKYKAVINPDKCFGCGVCVVGCEPEAIKMKVVRPPEHIPASPEEA